MDAALRALFRDPIRHGADPAWAAEARMLAGRARRRRVAPFARRAAAALILVAVGAGAGAWLTAPVARHDVYGVGGSAVQAHEASLQAGLVPVMAGGMAAPDLGRLGYRPVGLGSKAAEWPGAVHFVYADPRGHRRLSLFVGAPNTARGGDGDFSFAREGRRATFTWSDGGLSFALVGEVGRAEMLRLAKAVHESLSRGPRQGAPAIRPAAQRM
ncbi:MAG TPA: hypothetical protein VED40_19950 [Azospirillaceae bacterium]|nr:hypothetical protein [Azospirillaceae bacterium]